MTGPPSAQGRAAEHARYGRARGRAAEHARRGPELGALRGAGRGR